MDWTDLQKHWVPLSDPDKFLKYAKENHVSRPVAGGESYFEADRGSFYSDIIEYDFTNIPNIKSEISRITDGSGLNNAELLALITAVTMLKMKPMEVTARERFAAWERSGNKAAEADSVSASALRTHVAASPTEKKDDAPPDFYYPM
jgi:hypothetical protein